MKIGHLGNLMKINKLTYFTCLKLAKNRRKKRLFITHVVQLTFRDVIGVQVVECVGSGPCSGRVDEVHQGAIV